MHDQGTIDPPRGPGRSSWFTGLGLGLVLFSMLAVGHAQSETWELAICADPNVMPMSHRSEAGYENRIARVIADHLGAEITYDWYPFTVDMINLRLREGHCDVFLGVPDGYGPLLTTVAYYRSPYVFVYRADSGFDIASMDDPSLAELRIGLQDFGIPPHHALSARDLDDNVVATYGAERYAADPDPQAALVDAVIAGDIDVGISWGPPAGYYAKTRGEELRVVPVTPEIEMTPTFLSMVVPMTMGVRHGDDALRDRLGIAIAERWDDIIAILEEFGVPTTPMPRPTPTRVGP